MHCLEHKHKPGIEGPNWSFSNNSSWWKSRLLPCSTCLSPSLRGHRAWAVTHEMWGICAYSRMSVLSHSHKGERTPGGKFPWGNLFFCSCQSSKMFAWNSTFKFQIQRKCHLLQKAFPDSLNKNKLFPLLYCRTLCVPLSWSLIHSSLCHSRLFPCLLSPIEKGFLRAWVWALCITGSQ